MHLQENTLNDLDIPGLQTFVALVASNIIPYFCRKLGKMSQNLSSAAVVIGSLRVNLFPVTCSVGCR